MDYGRPPTRMQHRRGAALIELVLAIPLLATVIALTFFFGFATTNQQHVIACDRYVVWNAVEGGASATAAELNTMFFREQASGIGVEAGAGADNTLEDLLGRAYWESDQAGELLDRCLSDGWPRGRSAELAAEFPSDVPAWQQFTGAIHRYHAREGVEWTRGEVSYLEPIRDQFLSDLDAMIVAIPDQPLRESLRRLYLQRW